jgi:hypothetical protein
LYDRFDISHLECCRLQVVAWITRLAHDGRNRASTLEDLIAGALVCLPFGNQAAQALMEQLLVDDNIVSHVEGGVGIEPSDTLTVAEDVVGEKATSEKSRGLKLATRETR